ncbi:MAG: HNH endonuclease [Cyanobacteria bacterium]|nr:HNH endonuclease [Cyanobacteriota bacterium]
MSNVLVLNQSLVPLNICDWHRAASMIVRGRAEVLERAGKLLNGNFHLPLVVRLRNQVHVPYSPLTPNRSNILARDRYACQYCGKKHWDLTLDHIQPSSRGGKSTWENLVAACHRCNSKKGDKTPVEAGMRLLSKPLRPRDRISFMLMKQHLTDEERRAWAPYLGRK